MKRLITILASLSFAILAVVFIRQWVIARNTPSSNACVNNLRQINSAKDQWAIVNNRSNGTIASWIEVVPYLKGNAKPACQMGGTYTIGAVGEHPKCSVTEHAMPQ